MEKSAFRAANPVGYLVNEVENNGFANVFGRYLGLYRAIVVDNKDPQERGRVRLLIPAVGHEEEADVPKNVWALPCMNGLRSGS